MRRVQNVNRAVPPVTDTLAEPLVPLNAAVALLMSMAPVPVELRAPPLKV